MTITSSNPTSRQAFQQEYQVAHSRMTALRREREQREAVLPVAPEPFVIRPPITKLSREIRVADLPAKAPAQNIQQYVNQGSSYSASTRRNALVAPFLRYSREVSPGGSGVPQQAPIRDQDSNEIAKTLLGGLRARSPVPITAITIDIQFPPGLPSVEQIDDAVEQALNKPQTAHLQGAARADLATHIRNDLQADLTLRGLEHGGRLSGFHWTRNYSIPSANGEQVATSGEVSTRESRSRESLREGAAVSRLGPPLPPIRQDSLRRDWSRDSTRDVSRHSSRDSSRDSSHESAFRRPGTPPPYIHTDLHTRQTTRVDETQTNRTTTTPIAIPHATTRTTTRATPSTIPSDAPRDTLHERNGVIRNLVQGFRPVLHPDAHQTNFHIVHEERTTYVAVPTPNSSYQFKVVAGSEQHSVRPASPWDDATWRF